MGRTHLLAGACVALTVGFYVGCASKPKGATARKADPAQPVARGKHAKPQAADGGTIPSAPAEAPEASAAEVSSKSVAQHAEVYAHNLETLLAKRGATTKPGDVPVHEESADDKDNPAHSPGGANEPLKVAPEAQAQPQPQAAKKQPLPDSGEASTSDSTAVAPAAPAPSAPRAVSPRSPTVAPTADLLVQQLSARVKEYPRDVAAQLDFQLLQFLRDESVPDLAPLAPLPAEDRELLTTLLDGLSNFRNGLRAEANMLQSKKVSPLLEMGDRLRAQGELTLPATRLCTKVERFGVYDPMEPAQFKSGSVNEAILYCEVANFSSQLADNRQWETRLKHESVLYNETGLNVWNDKADTVTDLSRNRRHDFYVVKRLHLPSLPVGRYLLKVTVTDQQVNRVAEATVPILVVAQ